MTVSPYRDGRSGLQARLADLQKRWTAEAARVSVEALDVVASRHQRIAVGRVTVAVRAALLVGAVSRIMFATGSTFALDLMLISVFLGITLLARWWADVAAGRRMHEILAGPAAALGHPVSAMQALENLTPARAIAREASDLEAGSVFWHLLGAGWGCYLLCVAVAEPVTGRALLPLMAVLEGGTVGILALLLGLGGRAALAGFGVAGAAMLVLCFVGLSEDGAVGALIGVQLVTLAVRVVRLHRTVTHEREVLS